MEWRKRQYGRISGGDLERVLALFAEIWKERESLASLRGDSEQWVESFGRLVAVPNWVQFYESDFLKLVATLLIQTGEAYRFVTAAKDGVSALLNFVQSLPSSTAPSADALPAAMAMAGNLEAISLYSRTINDMVVAARAGDVVALGHAVSVDAYVLCFPFFLAGMRLDQFTGDTEFTKDVMRAICGPHKRRLEYVNLRWAEYLLREQDAFGSCSREEIYSLLVEHLRLYDPAGSKRDSMAGLFALLRKWQKQAGIQNPRFGFSGKKKA